MSVETVDTADVDETVETVEPIDTAEAEIRESEATESGPTLYDLKQIGEQIGVTYSRIRRFAESPGVAESLGAVKVKSVQGWRYPVESVEKWRQLMTEADRGLLTPKTAGAWLANQQTEPVETSAPAAGNTSAAALVGLMGELALGSDDSALTHIGPAQLVAAMMRLAEKLEQNAEAVVAAAPSKEPERWYTLVGAAEATGMSQKTIRENVPHVVEGSRKKWSGRDLAAYQEQAERHSKNA
ncbi:MAG: hypothetical protein V4671_11175 [Armatimonadota bacterium]